MVSLVGSNVANVEERMGKIPELVARKNLYLAILCDLFGMIK